MAKMSKNDAQWSKNMIKLAEKWEIQKNCYIVIKKSIKYHKKVKNESKEA